MSYSKLNLKQIDAIVFDFDGVLTNNFVHIDQEGGEWVSCNRSDGLAFDLLRKLHVPTYILSTEKNKVVSARAKKLGIPAIQGIANKVDALTQLAIEKNYSISRMLYTGNDINDYRVMSMCGYTACPSDSHQKILQIANFKLKCKGGEGVARELVESVFQIDILKELY
ncbi:MAG: HAD hydrolase family protein [Gammaproteobacteria bacterium]|nr:HAD hydrolase family protein [Gammaproteobacteria bacterium]